MRDGKEIQDHDEVVCLSDLHESQHEGRAKEHGDEVEAEGGQGAKWVAQGSTPLYLARTPVEVNKKLPKKERKDLGYYRGPTKGAARSRIPRDRTDG